jgi:AcrR family transcriptional regulator
MASRRTKKPPLPLTARGAHTRRRVLAAAEREIGERGFHDASVSSITRRARVAQGTFYTYFPSKDACFSALVESIGRDLRRQLTVAAGRARTRLAAERQGLEAFLAFVERHPHLYRIVEESQFVDPEAHRAYYERIAEGYAQALQAAAARGELASGDAQVRAWALMGIGHFLGLRYGLWRGRRPEKKTLDEVMRFIAQGMGPR